MRKLYVEMPPRAQVISQVRGQAYVDQSAMRGRWLDGETWSELMENQIQELTEQWKLSLKRNIRMEKWSKKNNNKIVAICGEV